MITIHSTDAPAVDRRTSADAVQRGTRYLLIGFAGLTALATNQLLVLGDHTDRFWPWTIQNRSTVAWIDAAYAAGFLLSVLSLRQRSWRNIRVAVATITVFTALTLVATLAHMQALHLSADDLVARGAAWFWLTVYVVVPAACLLILVRQHQGGRGADVAAYRPMPGRLRLVLAGQGAALLAAGVVLFASGLTVHHVVEPMADFWPWPLKPMCATVTGAWLIAFGAGAALVIRERYLSRLRVPAIAYAAFGVLQLVVLGWYRHDLTGPALSVWAYGALLATITATGAYGWWASRDGRS